MVPALPALIQFREKEAASRVGFFQRAQRKAARAQARVAAQHEHQALEQQADTEQAQRQYAIDEEWHRLVTNDPDTVIGALAEAFEDNEAAAAPLGVEGATASVVVQVPDADVLPDRMPSTTAAGNLSLKKTTKTQRNELYALMVAGYVVVTVKEAFADAPGLREVSIVAVRRAPADAYGRRAPEALMAARFARESLDGIQWHNADAVQVVNDAAEELILVQKGAAREIKPLDPKMHPDVAAALDVIDLDES